MTIHFKGLCVSVLILGSIFTTEVISSKPGQNIVPLVEDATKPENNVLEKKKNKEGAWYKAKMIRQKYKNPKKED
ncbi:MAG: hypothetical protein BGO67_10855 [Alphaproteobacteria bacterium 41-28]|nr:MAG: hypothetical protein BGO67_10855 [Alphaproteobacteria bacterium 41-28]